MKLCVRATRETDNMEKIGGKTKSIIFYQEETKIRVKMSKNMRASRSSSRVKKGNPQQERFYEYIHRIIPANDTRKIGVNNITFKKIFRNRVMYFLFLV